MLVFVALIAAACSGDVSDEFAGEPIFDDLIFEAEVDTDTGEAPDGLPFVEDEQTLRVSVSNLVYNVPYELEETNAVQVLLTDLLTDGLTRRDPVSGAIEPAIADSWTTSPDGLTWTFELGTATFGDGTVITADDVVVSLNRLADRGISSVSSPNLWPVEGWTAAGAGEDAPDVTGLSAVSDTQVEFTLTTPFAALAEILSGVAFGIVPEDADSLFVAEGELPLSSAVDFEPSEVWVDGLLLDSRTSEIDPVEHIEVFLDPEATMLAAGETDLAVGFEEAVDGTTSVYSDSTAVSYFAMNASQAPFDDTLIRQAILHAVDVEQLRDEFFPTADVMNRFVADGAFTGAIDSCGAACQLEHEEAQTLVQASPSRNVLLTIDYIDPSAGDDSAEGDEPAGLDEELALAVAEMLTDIGLNVETVGHAPEDFSRAVAEGELGMFRFGTVSSTLSAETSLGLPFHTTGLDNVSGTSIERVDNLIDEARSTGDDDARAQLYLDAERTVFAEAVVLPLVEFKHLVLLGSSLDSTSFSLEPDGSLNLGSTVFEVTE